MDLASEVRKKIRIGFVSGFLVGITFWITDLVRLLNIDWLDSIVFFAIMTPVFLIYSEKIPQIVFETEKEKDAQRQERERVKCQCGYEYEGNKVPANC